MEFFFCIQPWLGTPFRLLLTAMLVLLPSYAAVAQENATPRRYDIPQGPIVREVPPIDYIERPGQTTSPDVEKNREKTEWETLWESNATPDAEEVERIKRRRQEMEVNGTNRTEGLSGGYYREPFPKDDTVIRRRTHYPYLKHGELQRVPTDTYEPYP